MLLLPLTRQDSRPAWENRVAPAKRAARLLSTTCPGLKGEKGKKGLRLGASFLFLTWPVRIRLLKEMGNGERERGRERERERERERKRKRDRQTDRLDRQTYREIDRQRQRERQRETEKESVCVCVYVCVCALNYNIHSIGHSPLSHSSYFFSWWVLFSPHSFPPCLGLGSIHTRSRTHSPLPQETVQKSHSDQLDHPPSTGTVNQ